MWCDNLRFSAKIAFWAPSVTLVKVPQKGGGKRGRLLFLFWSPFGKLVVTVFDVFGHFFAYPLLPPPFCGRVT